MQSPFDKTSECLAKKHLDPEKYSRLKVLATDSGFTLDQAIQSGVANSDSSIGIYAGDAQSYELFSEVFSPVIQEYHCFSGDVAHCSDFSPVDLPDPDPERKYILSSRVRVARNIESYPYTCHLTLKERRCLEKDVVAAFNVLPDGLAGTYHSFEEEADAGLLFEKGDRFQEAAGINTDFPLCRGIFYSNDKRFRVWLNEEDHLRLISQDSSSDISGVFNHLGKALVSLSEQLPFARDKRYGYLATCPTNLGTSMRAGVHIRLKNLSIKQSLLRELVDTHQLQLRGTGGENTEVTDSVFDISNKRRLGLSEVDIITGLHKGLLAIIGEEKNCG
ncbi:phosphagen kinase [Desulforhopalus sp. 52FAK]